MWKPKNSSCDKPWDIYIFIYLFIYLWFVTTAHGVWKSCGGKSRGQGILTGSFLGYNSPQPSAIAVMKDTLWLFNIAMENGPFIDGLPIKNGDFP